MNRLNRLHHRLSSVNKRTFALWFSAALTIASLFYVARFTVAAFREGYDFSGVDWTLVVLGAAIAFSGYLVAPLLWIRFLRSAGLEGVSTRQLYGTYTRSWLARYVPGNVWNLGGRALLASRLGTPIQPLALSLVVEAFFLRAAPLVLAGSLAAGIWINWYLSIIMLFAGTMLMALTLWAAPRFISRLPVGRFKRVQRLLGPVQASSNQVEFRQWLAWSFAYLVFAVPGVLFVALFAAGFIDSGFRESTVVASGWALATVLGGLIIVSPAAFGARDGVALLALGPVLGAQEGALLVAASRIIITGLDVLFVVFGELLMIAMARMQSGRRRAERDPDSWHHVEVTPSGGTVR